MFKLCSMHVWNIQALRQTKCSLASNTPCSSTFQLHFERAHAYIRIYHMTVQALINNQLRNTAQHTCPAHQLRYCSLSRNPKEWCKAYRCLLRSVCCKIPRSYRSPKSVWVLMIFKLTFYAKAWSETSFYDANNCSSRQSTVRLERKEINLMEHITSYFV